VVACEPADVEPGMGLTDQVQAALPHAVRAVEEILAEARPAGGQQSGEQRPGEQRPGEQGAGRI
jgi:hypothetical protein